MRSETKAQVDSSATTWLSRPSFQQVYELTVLGAVRLARRLGVAEGDVDDVVQEVFLTVHRRLPEFEGRSSLKTWVLSIMRHLVLNYRRRLRRKGAVEVTTESNFEEEIRWHGWSDQAASVHRAQARLVFNQVFSSISDEKAIVFLMVELEGLTVAESAKILKANVNTIHSRLRAARIELARNLQDSAVLLPSEDKNRVNVVKRRRRSRKKTTGGPASATNLRVEHVAPTKARDGGR